MRLSVDQAWTKFMFTRPESQVISVVPDLIAAVDAFGVDSEQHFDAVPGPLGDLGRRDARVEPQRYAAVAEVVRTACQWGGGLRWGQAEQRARCHTGGRTWERALPRFIATEQAAVRRKPIARDVTPQDRDQLRRDRDDADGPAGPVFQATLFVAVPVSVHCLPRRGRGLMQFKAAPAGFGKVAVVGPERERLRWAQHREVQAGEERGEALAAARADVGDRGQAARAPARGRRRPAD